MLHFQIRDPPRSVARSSSQDHQTSWCCFFSISVCLKMKLVLNGSLIASGRPEVGDALVSVIVFFEDLADTVLHAWSRFQLCIPVEILVIVHVGACVVQFPRKHCGAFNWFFFALADATKDFLARLFMLENQGFIIAAKLDQLLRVNVACVMMLTNSVSCVHLSLVNDPIVRMSPPPIVVL